MKKLLLISVLFLGLLSTNGNTASAQVNISVNIGNQPSWGPSGHNFVRFYFLPELNVYYDVTNGMYIYLSGNRWIRSRTLPPRFAHFDLYRTYKVVIVNDRNPWRNHRSYINRFGRYARIYDRQTPNRDRPNNQGNRPGNNGNGNQNNRPGNNNQGNRPGNNGNGNQNNRPENNNQGNRPGNNGNVNQNNRPGNNNQGTRPGNNGNNQQQRPDNNNSQGGGRR